MENSRKNNETKFAIDENFILRNNSHDVRLNRKKIYVLIPLRYLIKYFNEIYYA